MNLSLPAGPDARRRPSHLKGFLRLLPFLLAAMGLAWLALDAAIFRESARNLRDMERVSSFHRDYRDFSEAEALLKEGSDRLTQAVRRFAATGFPRFIEDYENEEKVGRHRERALAIIDAKLPPDHPARDAMHEAMARSLALQDVEHRAMRLVAEAFGMDVEGLPEHLRQVVLSPEEAALDAAGKRQRAFDLLYSDDYFAAKAGIWARVQEFLDHTIGRTADDFDAASQSAIRSTNRQMILFTLALAVVFGALILSASVGYAMFARMTRKNLGLMDDLRRERDATLAAEKARSMFFSMVSHDIRTPLNSIIGFSELIVQGVEDDRERTEAAENVLFSARTLLALVNDVLDLSKLDADKMKFVPAPCDFPEMLSRVAATFRIQAAGKDISIEASSAPMPRLMVDEERIRQVLVNLASNAVKFTKKGGVELTASFEPDVPPDAGQRPGVPEPPRAGRRGTLRFSVHDTGIGIAPDDQKRIMDPFVQVGPSGTGGTGLGLTICKRLLERMGGELRLESEPGVGSTFTAVLPGLETAAPAAAEDDEEGGHEGAHATKRSSEPVRSILLVDDVHVNLLVEKALLTRAGITDVETAPSAPKALEALRRRPFDLVLTDLWMPKMDGYALCREIRADPALAKLRVHAVTADVEARKLALSRGFDGLLLKPITADTLARFLASL